MDAATVTRICLLMHRASLSYLEDLDDANGANAYFDEMREVSELLKNFPTTYTDSSLRIERHISKFDRWDVCWSIDNMCAEARFTETPKMSLVSFKAYNEPHPAIKAKPLPSDFSNKGIEVCDTDLLGLCHDVIAYCDNVSDMGDEALDTIMKQEDFALRGDNANILFTKRGDVFYALIHNCHRFYKVDGKYIRETLSYFDLVMSEEFLLSPIRVVYN